MCCRCAGWQPSRTHDTPSISCVYLPVWETVVVGECLYGVRVCVYMCPYGKRCLWVSPFISSLITVPTGTAEQESLSNAKALSLLAHNTHRLAVSHSPLTVYLLLRLQLPAPNTHTTCSSDCLPGTPDSGQLIFSLTHRLINTTPHYSGLMQKQPRQASQTCYNLSRLLFLQSCLNL